MDTYRHVIVEYEHGVCKARLRKTRLEEAEIHQLGDELTALAQKEGCGKIVLSLGPQPPDCLYSVFLAKLISVRNAARKNGGELVLCNLSTLAYSVFEACQLHREFIFRPDFDSAVSYFAVLAAPPA